MLAGIDTDIAQSTTKSNEKQACISTMRFFPPQLNQL